jgi:HupE/UreJ protein
MRRVLCVAAIALLFASVVPRITVFAHDIPNDVVTHAFVNTEGGRLRVVVRVPLRAMRDIQFPQRGQGFLDLPRADQSLRDAAVQWILPALDVYQDGASLGRGALMAARASLASDRSLATWPAAVAHVTGARLADDTQVPWDQVSLDALIEYPLRSSSSTIAIRPGFARLGVRVVTVLQYVTADGRTRGLEFTGDPGTIDLDPRWHRAARQFVGLGFRHILDGPDHLLFLLCLVIPFRRVRPLIVVVTAFTVAHSITLIASAYGAAPGGLWFPPLIETLIAVSIVYMALENIVTAAGAARRWAIAFGFGLVHGFGFSFALKETMQFAGGHLLTALLSFNIGVELGQLLVLAALVPALRLLFRHVVAERMGTIVLSVIVAHTAWHWMWERWAVLRQYRLPAIGLADVSTLLLWAMIGVIVAAGIWFVGRVSQTQRALGSGVSRRDLGKSSTP